MRPLLVSALFLAACAQPAPDDVYDPFDSPSLSRLWATDRFAPGAVTMQSAIVRAGRGAAKITLHTGEVFERGIKGSKDSERAELSEPERLYSRENATYEYTFSEYLPADFPIVPTRLVIAQWKQYCNGHEPCDDDAPVVALRYVSGVLRITLNTSPHRRILYEAPTDLRGHWTDFRFQLRFTPTETGLIRAWIDGRQAVDYTGPTAYPESNATGYARPSLFYFKMGLYRDVMPEPMTLYLDEYRKRRMAP